MPLEYLENANFGKVHTLDTLHRYGKILRLDDLNFESAYQSWFISQLGINLTSLNRKDPLIAGGVPRYLYFTPLPPHLC